MKNSSKYATINDIHAERTSCNTEKREVRKWKKTTLISGAVIGVLLLFTLFQFTPTKTDTTTINFYIPQDFYLIYMDFDNESIIGQYNYSVYIVSTSGIEQDYNDIGHNEIFINKYLLAWFLDIEQYNMSVYDESMNYNDKTVSFSFKHNKNNTYFGINAFDLSLYNGTNNLRSMDFGNDIFINIPLGYTSNIRINNITCHRLNDTIFQPYLYYTYNNIVYHERMAWNNNMTL